MWHGHSLSAPIADQEGICAIMHEARAFRRPSQECKFAVIEPGGVRVLCAPDLICQKSDGPARLPDHGTYRRW